MENIEKNKIIFFFPYPLYHGPSQRFRFTQYLSFLNENFDVKLSPFINEQFWNIYHKKGNFLKKAIYLFFSYFKRFVHVFRIYNCDFVFIHREMAPIGPPIFEFIVSKVFRKKIIYDFDDAIWLENYNENNKTFQMLKNYSKVNKIIKWSYKISVGNEYLADYSFQFNKNVYVIPTTIDTENYHNSKLYNVSKNDKITIGWTGSATTNQYLLFLESIFLKLEEKYDFIFNVISDVNPNLKLKNFVFTKWNKKNEVKDLLKFDIGLMPLVDNEWARGKCGFKALQYMSLGIPAIVSPVGVNTKIINDNINGFIAYNDNDWYEILNNILSNKINLSVIRENAIKKVTSEYSVISNKDKFLNLFT